MAADRPRPRAALALALASVLLASPLCRPAAATEPVLLLCGIAAKPAMERITADFTAATGVPVETSFGASGALLTQIKLSGRGDVFFPASSDFIERGWRDGLVAESTDVIYLVPALVTAKGNPLRLKSLADLSRPGLRVALAHPSTVALGLVAVEMIERGLPAATREALRRNVVTYADNAERLAMTVALGAADAAVGWSVFARWQPERIESVPLPPGEIVRLGTMGIAVTTRAKDPAAARRFAAFVLSPAGRARFETLGYHVTRGAACAEAGAEKPAGGDYAVPAAWLDGAIAR